MEEEKTKETELSVLFPVKKIDMGGVEVTITPIPLTHVAELLDAFGNMMYRVKAGISPAAMVSECLKDALKLLPYCVNISTDKIPAAYAPDLIIAMIELNFTKEFAEKWQALSQTIKKMVPESQGEDTKKKKKG